MSTDVVFGVVIAAVVVLIVLAAVRLATRGSREAAKPVAAAPATPMAPPQQVPLYAMVTMPDGSQQMVPVPSQMLAPTDAPNGGFATLGFFFPVVGLILFLVWKDQTPLKARSAGKGALIGVIVDFVIVVAYVILIAVLFRSLS